MSIRRKGKVVVLHLAARYPLAGVIWQLIHHLVGFSRLGLDVCYIEDHGAWVYDLGANTVISDPTGNVELLDPEVVRIAEAHHFFFTYAANIGQPDCVLPTGGLAWHPTRPPVLLDEWPEQGAQATEAPFTTVGTWRNKGNDVELGGRTYYWSKHRNFVKMLDVPRRAGQAVELATDLSSGFDYRRALEGGFSFRPVVPMSLDLDAYRNYITASRGEFTPSKDFYVATRSEWFSDRSVCYLAAGRPVITQGTGFEKFIPARLGLVGFDEPGSAAEALSAVNADYARHARAAREVACEYFDAARLLDNIAAVIGL